MAWHSGESFSINVTANTENIVVYADDIQQREWKNLQPQRERWDWDGPPPPPTDFTTCWRQGQKVALSPSWRWLCFLYISR